MTFATCQFAQSFGKLGREKCKRSEVEIFQYSRLLLNQILTDIDTNHHIRRISLTIRHESNQAPIKYGEALDEFLTSRPWWTISKEGLVTRKDGIDNNVKVYEVYSSFLIRYYQPIEPLLHNLAAIQFPPPEVCAATRLGVGHLVDSGWGAQLGMYGSFARRHPWVVFNIWDSVDNSPSSGVMYSAGSTCPNLVNKRLCAFLPITNCSMPALVTDAVGVAGIQRAWPQNIIMYTSATVSAQPTVNDLSLYLHMRRTITNDNCRKIFKYSLKVQNQSSSEQNFTMGIL